MPPPIIAAVLVPVKASLSSSDDLAAAGSMFEPGSGSGAPSSGSMVMSVPSVDFGCGLLLRLGALRLVLFFFSLVGVWASVGLAGVGLGFEDLLLVAGAWVSSSSSWSAGAVVTGAVLIEPELVCGLAGAAGGCSCAGGCVFLGGRLLGRGLRRGRLPRPAAPRRGAATAGGCDAGRLRGRGLLRPAAAASAPADPDPDRVERGRLVGALHHRDAVRAVTGPGRALRGALGRHAGDLDGHGVRLGAALLVLGRHEERRHRGRVVGLAGAGQHPAGGVEVAADQPVLQHRALHVVTALAGREEPVPDQVAGADLQLERLAGLDRPGRLGDQQGRVVLLRADLAELGGDALVAELEAVVALELAVLAGVGRGSPARSATSSSSAARRCRPRWRSG